MYIVNTENRVYLSPNDTFRSQFIPLQPAQCNPPPNDTETKRNVPHSLHSDAEKSSHHITTSATYVSSQVDRFHLIPRRNRIHQCRRLRRR